MSEESKEIQLLPNEIQGVKALVEDRDLAKRSKGAVPLKKLNQKHRVIIALHLEGYKNNDIAEIVKMTPSRVSIILHDPLAREIIEASYSEADERMAALYPRAVDAVKKGLEDFDSKVALKAAELYLKSQGKFKDPSGSKEKEFTAEDVARQIIHIKGEATITTEQGRRLSIEDKKDER